MMTLYCGLGAGSVAPEAFLVHLGIPFESRFLAFDDNGYLEASIAAVNPRKQIPALVLADGSVLTESVAIMLHLADGDDSGRFSFPLGSTERAQIYRWMTFLATNVYEGMLRLLYSDRYLDSDDGTPVKTESKRYLDDMFALLEGALGDRNCLVGNEPGICEIYLSMLITWYSEPQNLLDRHPKMNQMFESTMKLEGVRDVFARNELI